MPIIVSSYQHCDGQQFQTLSCALYTIVFSNKARFSHISTVTKLHSYCGKKYAYASRASCFLHRNQYFLTVLRQNIQQKVLASREPAPYPVANVQIQYYIIIFM